jgi:hypothetical protein
MDFRPNNGSMRRVFAVALAFVAAAGWLRADAIIFSKPAVPLAVPPKAEDALPKFNVDEEMDFMPTPLQPQQPMITTPRVIETQRPRDPDDDEKEHWLLRDPFKNRDPMGKNPLKEQTKKDPIRAPWQVQAMKKREKDEIRSLAPVKEFDWNESDPRRKNGDLLSEWRRDQQEKPSTDERERHDPLQPRKDRRNERHDPLQPPMNFESFGNRTYEKPTMAQLERRAAFEQLLNPTAPANVKQLGSLEPVLSMDALKTPKPLAPAPLPSLNTANARIDRLDRGPLDPTAQFRERQSRLYESDALQDPNQRYAVQPKSTSPKVAEPIYKTPLLQQPIRRDIPSRQF